jgi:lipoprotein NlpD
MVNYKGLLGLLIAAMLTACAGPPPAPVEDRSSGNDYQATPDGHYRVKKGDSLYAISFRFGTDWRELARWNNIQSPYVIHPGQLLRVGATTGTPSNQSRDISGSGVQTAAAPAPGSQTRALDTPRTSTSRSTETEPVTQSAATSTPATPATQSASVPSSSKGSQQPAGVSYSSPAGDPDRWLWPTEGRIISNFQANDATRKGIDIGGTSGQKVVASAGGQVVYSGSGLIGYGELIIIKHSDRMLSAYAHNRKRLVSEGEQVAAGATIAEMGTNDRNQAILHFEIRVNGNPTDPLNFLPKR